MATYTQKQVLDKVKATITALGYSYNINYSPLRNLSEQSGTLRYIQPRSLTKNKIMRGSLQTEMSVLIGIVGLSAGDSSIESANDELETIMDKLIGTNPLYSDGIYIVASESQCVNEMPLDQSALDNGTPIISGQILITLRYC